MVEDAHWVINSTVREKPKPHLPEIRVIVEKITVFGDQLNAGLKMLLPWDDFIFFFQSPAYLFAGSDASM